MTLPTATSTTHQSTTEPPVSQTYPSVESEISNSKEFLRIQGSPVTVVLAEQEQKILRPTPTPSPSFDTRTTSQSIPFQRPVSKLNLSSNSGPVPSLNPEGGSIRPTLSGPDLRPTLPDPSLRPTNSLISPITAFPVPLRPDGAIYAPRPAIPGGHPTYGGQSYSEREDRFQTNFLNPQSLPGQVYTPGQIFQRTGPGQVYPPGQGYLQVPGQNYRGVSYYRTTEAPGFIESIGQSALDLTKGFFSWPF